MGRKDRDSKNRSYVSHGRPVKGFSDAGNEAIVKTSRCLLSAGEATVTQRAVRNAERDYLRRRTNDAIRTPTWL